MTSDNKISMDATLNLDNGQVRIRAIGDQLAIAFDGAEVVVTDAEIRPFLLTVRAAANAAGVEHMRQFDARYEAKWGTPRLASAHADDRA